MLFQQNFPLFFMKGFAFRPRPGDIVVAPTRLYYFDVTDEIVLVHC